MVTRIIACVLRNTADRIDPPRRPHIDYGIDTNSIKYTNVESRDPELLARLKQYRDREGLRLSRS